MSVPSPRVYVNGDTASPVSGDNLNTFVQTFATAAQLRTLTGVSGMEVALQGISAVGDGGQGNFCWSVSSTAADDNATVIRPTGVTVGAWIRLPTSVAGSDATLSTVTVPGSTTARTLGARFGQVFSVLDYGAKCDGSTDDTAAVNAAILAAVTAGGGVVVWPDGTCFMAGPFIIPYTGSSHPLQVPLRFTGQGAPVNPYLNDPAPTGGTVINNTYNAGGAYAAKIDTRGGGLLEIDHLLLTDSSNSGAMFIATTNTALYLHDMGIRGYTTNSGTACVQDAIRLGGITSASTILGGTGNTNGFQGYGTRIDNVWFSHIREAVQFGGSANQVFVSNAVVDTTCGSSKAQGAPFVFYGQGYGASGNTIFGGVIEVTHYPYGATFLDDGTGSVSNICNLIVGVGWYDEVMSAPTLGGVYFSLHSTNNSVMPSFADTAIQLSGSTPIFFAGPGKLLNTLWNIGGFPSQVYGSVTGLSGVSSGTGNFTGAGDYATLATPNSPGNGLEVYAPSGATTLFVSMSASSGSVSPVAANASLTVNANGTGTLTLGASTNSAVKVPNVQAASSYANDAAAAGGGVPIGGLYRNGSVVQIRVA